MKLLVLSDSHGRTETLVNIIQKHPDADAIIFLGDGERDFEKAVQDCNIGEEKIVCQVRGNCDCADRHPEIIVRDFDGTEFLMTHGHEQNVKLAVWGLVDEAKKRKCTVALYGHTHYESFLVKEGITLINPGSAREGKYCVIEVDEGKLKCSHLRLQN